MVLIRIKQITCVLEHTHTHIHTTHNTPIAVRRTTAERK